ncbi:Dabb family protein [Achromobacter marplatensis]|uniref:Dabb family protein n=1 Tax=Achromobacter marplatensis TaxID=470868 RepID=UPI0028E58CF5|nr:Dabb family protein [Achromobacter marplatensis]
MILHLVIFKFRNPFQWCDDEVVDAEASTRQHPKHIKEISSWFCARNISLRKQAMDFVVMGLFKNQEDLSAYLIHPDHQQGVRKWKEIANWRVVDIDLGSDTTSFFGLLSGLAGTSSSPIKN